MLVGCCTSYKDEARMRILKESGYNFVEASFSGLSEGSGEEIERYRNFLKEINMPCLSVNGMFPSSIRLTGREADHKKAEEYIYSTLERTSNIGYNTIIFGSSGARNIPDGYDKQLAVEQIKVLCRDVIAPAMKKYGCVLGIEELCKREGNIINTCADAMEIINDVDSEYIKLLVDMYHVDVEGTSYREIETECAKSIVHVHIASAKNNREIPHIGDGEEYGEFLKSLKRAGYEQMNVSLEGRISRDFREAVVSARQCLLSAE